MVSLPKEWRSIALKITLSEEKFKELLSIESYLVRFYVKHTILF
jgi:hypothetical protein